MMVSVGVITQEEVMRDAVEFRANIEAQYGLVPSWEQAFAARRCDSCGVLECFSHEASCMDCCRMERARKEAAARDVLRKASCA